MGLFTWLSAMGRRLGLTRPTRRVGRFALSVEPLEPRETPAAANPLTIAGPAHAVGVFGSSVAVSGNDVVVGGTGAAYLYDTSGHLLHTFQSPNPSNGFGAPVAISGNDILIGASSLGTGGIAYLFNTSGQLLQTYVDPLAIAGDNFGSALAISGNDVLIGARGADAAYLFDTSGNLRHTFEAQDQAGVSKNWVALDGNKLLVGSVTANGQTGVARLYSTDGDLLHTFVDPQAAGGMPDWFGASVSLSGNNVLIGADDANNTEGLAYLYNTSGQLLHTFQAPGAKNGDFFGSTVVVSGNNVLVAAMYAYANPGIAYLYKTAGQLVQTYSDPHPVKDDGFAGALAISDSFVAIGSYGSGYSGGSAYLYHLPSPVSAPVLALNPVSQTVTAYQIVTFTASATGNPPPAIQWQMSTDGGKTFWNILGSTSISLSVLVLPLEDGWEFRAVFSNSAGTIATSAARLMVQGSIFGFIRRR
jgi:hypothetical protein